MPDIAYAQEKFSNAIRGMAVSPNSLRRRLCDAYVYHVIHIGHDTVPPELQPRLADLAERMTHRPARNAQEGKCEATTDQMSDVEADEAAGLILDLGYEIEFCYYAHVHGGRP